MAHNVALNRTTSLLLNNTSGQDLAFGDVGILDPATAESFTLSGGSLTQYPAGVVLEPNGIASGGRGLIGLAGYLPRLNLTNVANVGDLIRLSATLGRATAFANTAPAAGDFAVALSSGSAPNAYAFGALMRM